MVRRTAARSRAAGACVLGAASQACCSDREALGVDWDGAAAGGLGQFACCPSNQACRLCKQDREEQHWPLVSAVWPAVMAEGPPPRPPPPAPPLACLPASAQRLASLRRRKQAWRCCSAVCQQRVAFE